MIERLKAQGITILVSTSYMDEAGLCDRIALMQSGKILSIDTPENISASYPDKLFAVKASKMSALLKALSKFPKAANSYAFGEYAHITIENAESAVDEVGNVSANATLNIENEIRNYLEKQGLENIEVKPIKATIEDCFIKLLK